MARFARAVILLDPARSSWAFSLSAQLLMKRNSAAAFTLIEMLVVIAIIAVLAAFAVPAITSALARGQMTGTMNNARQLYLSGFQMATDGATNSDPNLTWPGDGTVPGNLQEYVSKLVQNDYLKIADLQKMLNAPGATCTITASTSTPPGAALTGTSALKVYKIKETDPSNTIFAATSNYVYNTALVPTAAPYGDKGFVVIRKGGDAGTFRKNQAVASSGTDGGAKFQANIGRMTGDTEGTVGSESGEALTFPAAP